jgi:hypothetical protein
MPETGGIGAGRRKTLAAIEDKDHLDPVDGFDGLDELTAAVRDLSLGRNMSPPSEVIETIETVHDRLPEEARPHYVADETLRRRINAARRQFNEWMGRRKRVAEMPSPVEAGPANYPAGKARKRTRSERTAREELYQKIDRVKSAANGARQRALNAIGSSIAEQNEQDREERRERMRDRLEAGDIVRFRNPSLYVGEVVRVNQKTVTVRYENPRAGTENPLTGEEPPEYCEARIDLESEFLEPLDADTIAAGQEVAE